MFTEHSTAYNIQFVLYIKTVVPKKSIQIYGIRLHYTTYALYVCVLCTIYVYSVRRTVQCTSYTIRNIPYDVYCTTYSVQRSVYGSVCRTIMYYISHVVRYYIVRVLFASYVTIGVYKCIYIYTFLYRLPYVHISVYIYISIYVAIYV